MSQATGAADHASRTAWCARSQKRSPTGSRPPASPVPCDEAFHSGRARPPKPPLDRSAEMRRRRQHCEEIVALLRVVARPDEQVGIGLDMSTSGPQQQQNEVTEIAHKHRLLSCWSLVSTTRKSW